MLFHLNRFAMSDEDELPGPVHLELFIVIVSLVFLNVIEITDLSRIAIGSEIEIRRRAV
jgi:hypothetical protein